MKKNGRKFQAYNQREIDMKVLHADPSVDLALLAPEKPLLDCDYYDFSQRAAQPGDDVHIVTYDDDHSFDDRALSISSGKVIDKEASLEMVCNFLNRKLNLSEGKELSLETISKEKLIELNKQGLITDHLLDIGSFLIEANGKYFKPGAQANYLSEEGSSGAVVLDNAGQIVGMNTKAMLPAEDYQATDTGFITNSGEFLTSEQIFETLDSWGLDPSSFS